jgi:hypothetical protein
MSDLPVDLLACPRCAASPLAFVSGQYACAACGTQFPSLDDIPWLFAEPGASLGEWRERLHRLVLELGNQAASVRSELDAPGLLTSTRSRLKLLSQAYADHARRLQALLTPLSLQQKTASLETHLALRTRLPPSQDLASYYVNLHRDWMWGAEENEAALALLNTVNGSRALGKTLVFGAGAGRLAYDVHERLAPELTVAVDINPLLLLVARRIVRGECVSLYEFPIAPRGIDDHALLRELRAPAPARDGFHFVFADVLRAPFREESWDTIVTPWVIDILPADLAELAPRINRLLKSGGRWLNFGSLAFAHREAARCYSLEETLEVLAHSGFACEPPREVALPYMRSPASRHARVESVVAFAAAKSRTIDAPPPFSTLPEWIVHGDRPVPLSADFQMACVATRIYAFVMSLIDGRRSLEDIARVLVEQRLMSAEEAGAAVRAFLIRMHEDSRAGRR